MRGGAKGLLPAVLTCALSVACGPVDDDPGPGPVTVGEAKALEQAAEMLDEQRMPAEAEAAIGEGQEQQPVE